MLAAIRIMNRLELVGETLRAALNELATLVPGWLRAIAPADWHDRYDQRVEQSRLPVQAPARQAYAAQVGGDGVALLEALEIQQPHLLTLATVQTLRQVWVRHFTCSEVGEVRWRAEKDLPRAAGAIESPYETEARHSNKRDLSWTGYKVHLTETCDPELPRLITHVHTTVATTQDVSCTADIQLGLAARDLLPARHLVDTGYVDAELLVDSQERHGVELFGPTRYNPSWQAREGGYDATQFTVDWDAKRAICPEGKVSVGWYAGLAKPYNHPVVHVKFSSRDCTASPSRAKCVRSKTGQPRGLVLCSRAHHEALQQARARMTSEEGRLEYQKRAGVEGSLSQGVRRSGLRRCRYRGLSKTRLQHVATAVALNVVRVVNYLNDWPIAPTRVSRFARLAV